MRIEEAKHLNCNCVALEHDDQDADKVVDTARKNGAVVDGHICVRFPGGIAELHEERGLRAIFRAKGMGL